VTRPDSRAAVGVLDDLPELATHVDGGPAILVIGDVVAHSALWRRQNLNPLVSDLLEAAE
jgi:uroporphyrin-III C-methyltransferase/precorrin-2 dehydrogenase/sirohydrochlorin ferrochelatase